MHGGFSDTEQQKIVEQFALADSAGPGPAHRRRGLRGRQHAPAVPPPDPLRPAVVADPHRAAQRPHRPLRAGAPAAVRRADPHLRRPRAPRTTPPSPRSCCTGRRRRTAASAPPRASPASSPPRKEEDRLVKDLLAGKTVEESDRGGRAPTDRLPRRPARRGRRPAGDAAPDRAPTCRELFASTEAFAREALDSRRARRCTSTTTARCSPSRRRTTWCSGSPSCRRPT